MAYSVGFTMTDDICDAILKVPARAWTPAYDSGGLVRPGAWVAELTGMLDVASWPKGMRHNRSPSRSLASKPSRPADQPKTIQRPGKDTAGQWNPPARHGSRAQTLTTVSKRPQAAGLKPASQDHERCRLV